ncbi:hypothetical protein CA13_15850 [Planctomycetes bacterium CA13]|uniref:Uncharacterized protein n=2 Tax=Novipirellula herctigrandis TaxID=2527986 RepID=A0A5C5YYN0_9BACT|nr:hypothetical protein CA13_15850 [Planctomycetes bacterium CA13]
MVVVILLTWQILLTIFLTLAGLEDRKLAAMSGMLWGLNLLWIIGMGGLSISLRKYVAESVVHSPKRIWLKFFCFVTALALVEEAITTTMTNCAPLFGVKMGEVYITASANYFDVVLFHSVVVFLPQFAMWGWLLKRYALSPFAAFLMYGLTGFINEALFAGPNPLMLAQWILVYGLLVYLPANLFNHLPDRRRVRWWLYPAAVVLPILASIPMVMLLLLVIAPGHPSIHFPPMGAE